MAQLFIDRTDNVLFLDEAPRGKKGIFLTVADEFVLKRIYAHKILSSHDIHKVYQFFNPERSKQSIANRINRLMKSNLIIRREPYNSKRMWSPYYFYTLSARGYYALEQLNYIPIGFSQKNLETVRIPNEHDEFAITLMMEFSLRFFEQVNESDIMRGSVHKLFDLVAYVTPVMPDYILQFEKAFFCLEFDTGSEPMHMLTTKTKRYLKLQEEGRFEGLQPFIIYVVRSNERTTPQLKRIQNIKAAHSSLHQDLKQLPIYVVSDIDFLELMARFIKKEYPLPPHVPHLINTDVSMFYQQKYRLAHGWDSARVTLDKIVSNAEAAARGIYPSCTMLKYFNYRATMRTQLYIAQELGSVRDYYLMANLLAELEKTKDNLFVQEYTPLEVVVTFPYISDSIVSAQRLGVQPPVKVILQSELEIIESLKRIDADDEELTNGDKYTIHYYVAYKGFKLLKKRD